MKFVVVIAALLPLALANPLAIGLANTGSSAVSRSEDGLGNYAFGYNEDHATGGTFRKEKGGPGVQIGSYGLRAADGRMRIVNYVADALGFRASVSTNEPGTDIKQDPAAIFQSGPVAMAAPVAVAAAAPVALAAPAAISTPIASSYHISTKHFSPVMSMAAAPVAVAAKTFAAPADIAAPIASSYAFGAAPCIGCVGQTLASPMIAKSMWF